MYNLVPSIGRQFFDNNGVPLAGGFVYTYLAGTTTPQSVYTDSTGVTPQTNPIVLDANGRAEMWMSPASAYKFVIEDSSNNVISTEDNVTLPGSSNTNASTGWVTFNVTDGQLATNLSGMTVDGSVYTSALVDYEIIRGTTVMANGLLYMQYKNGSWLVNVSQETGDASGVTYSVTQTTTVGQLQAALNSGAGNGTIKMSWRLVPV